ncbi:MAG TPA: hypothetical protein PKW90_25380, partial [Myxococcota bacterium]|nr:hypothetical protein [Myxococcota bacterium]
QANRIQIGVLVGGGMEAVSDAKAWAGWGTLGLRYRPQGAAWAVGATASQLGVAGSDRGWVDLPAVLQAGGTYRFDLGRWALIPGADFRWVADEEWVVPVGLEARWEGAALRAGFPIGRPEAAPSFGAGWQSETWGIDLGLGWHWALGLAPSGRISVRL